MRSLVGSLVLCAGVAAADPPGATSPIATSGATPPLAAPAASTRYEVFGDGVLPIGGELHGFGVGVGPEVQIVRDDGEGRTLSAGVHFTVHRMMSGMDVPSYVGGVALERRWGERSWWGFYWGLRLDGTAAFWQASRAWGVAPGIVVG